MSGLSRRGNVTEREQVQSRPARIFVHCCDGEEDDPGENPDGEEHFDHHAEKADEEVGVHAVKTANVAVISLVNGDWP